MYRLQPRSSVSQRALARRFDPISVDSPVRPEGLADNAPVRRKKGVGDEPLNPSELFTGSAAAPCRPAYVNRKLIVNETEKTDGEMLERKTSISE
jgi:hypothetical protein